MDLIHRDSKTSPFYDPSLTYTQRLAVTLHRSFARARFFTSIGSRTTNIFPNPKVSDYLMRISIGTPPQEIIGTADTGSDIIWTQCQPCSYCYNQTSPIYNPTTSLTFNRIACNSTTCALVPMRSCFESDNTCLYLVMYGDLSYSSGELATETITVGGSDAFRDMVFGCGHRNAGMFSDDQSGIIGLGGGPTSLISQMGSLINKKFSYCLVQMFSNVERSSKMYFGDVGNVSGDGVVLTPMFSGNPNTFYYLNFEGITVKDQRVDFYLTKPRSIEGNIIIDSGTSLTFFPENFYNRLELVVRRSLGDIRPIGRDVRHNLGLCYDLLEVLDLPIMVAHFNGADLELDPMNTFVQMSNDSICLAFAPADGVAIFGNIAQMNYLVGYDLDKKTISFKRTDCTKL